MAFLHTRTTSGRESIDATGDDVDWLPLVGGICVEDPHTGQMRPATIDEMKAMGIRQIVAAKDIITGEWRRR